MLIPQTLVMTDGSYEINIDNVPDPVTININGTESIINGDSSNVSFVLKNVQCGRSNICVPCMNSETIYKFNNNNMYFDTDKLDFQIKFLVELFNIEWYRKDIIHNHTSGIINFLQGFIDNNTDHPITFSQEDTNQVNIHFLYNSIIPLSQALNSECYIDRTHIGNLHLWYNYIKRIILKKVSDFSNPTRNAELLASYEHKLFEEAS